MGKKISVGEALVELLSDYGVDLVFGIPGTHSIELYRGLDNGKIRHISPRHEQGGGFMADGYARVSGKPGVCFVITGAGVTNITTPMGEAYSDSIPMLIISPVNDPDPNDIHRGRLHEITNQSAVTKPLTAFSETVFCADQIPELIARAFEIFSSERPRPVHISIPLSIIPQIVEASSLKKWDAVTPPKPRTATNDEISSICKSIETAKNPVLVVGGGTRFGADSVRILAEKICCPVITTVAGRGVIPQDHPLCVGAQLRAPYVQDILGQSDLGIFIGTELSQTDHWNDDLKLPNQQIWVNLCPHALERETVAQTFQVDGLDCAFRLAELLPESEQSKTNNVHSQCEVARQIHQQNFTNREHIHWKVLSEMINHVPEDATIVSDMTQLAYTAVDYLPMMRPNQWLHPTGYGTLGYALPAAIGAVLADELKSALVIVGDAGLQYTMQEMTLAAELNLNIVVLLWNNDALQQICDDMDNAKISRIGIFQQNPEFIALAKACGWASKEVDGLTALGEDLTNAFGVPGPVLLKLDEFSIQ